MAGNTTKVKKINGRPTKYSQELAAKLCEQLSEGISLRTVCLAKEMPNKSTVFNWLHTNQSFLDQYTRAKQESADAMAEDVIDIADNEDQLIEDGSGGYRHNPIQVQRDRLRIETRKWLMAKMKPKKYGDKLDLTSDGKVLPTPIFGGNSAKTD